MITYRRLDWTVVTVVMFVFTGFFVANSYSDQIELTPASVIGGSGSWDTRDWNVGQFQAGYVADNQFEDEIDESDQNPGDANGGFWLGKENDEEEFFVLDLGQEYTIQQIDLYNTHNAQFDDRATNGYEIYGGNSVVPTDDPDFQAGGDDLADAVLIAEGELELLFGADDPLVAQSADITNGGPFRYIRFSTVGPFHEDDVILAQRSVGINEIKVFGTVGGGTALRAGDANQDLNFNQVDLVQVQIANKYLSGQAATWGEGDWDGAPGGQPGMPPPGDGFFNQLDIIAALTSGVYLTGPYAAVKPEGQGSGNATLVYNPSTGELAVNVGATELTSINIDSAAAIFTGDAAINLGGSFDNDADNNIFKATFGSSFGSLTFGNVAQTGLSQDFVLNDLAVIGSLAGGGDLGEVDLIYVPEPSQLLLCATGMFGLLALCARHARFRQRPT